jgi:hypothetical protein
VSEIEKRIGITPIDKLLEYREALVNEAASLYAVYGPFGTAEHRRKVALATAELQVRAEATEKMTEGKVDALARTHPTYLAFLDAMETGRAQWLLAENNLQAVGDQIARENQLVRYATSEPR